MKHIRNACGMLVAAAVFLMVTSVVEIRLLYAKVHGVSGPVQEWLGAFWYRAAFIIGFSLFLSAIWYVMGHYFFKLDSYRKSDRRQIWLLLLLPLLIAVILSAVSTPPAQEGRGLAFFLYAINGFVTYYVATALFSPSSFKYTPPLSAKLRQWW